jgi:hypothetical protein
MSAGTRRPVLIVGSSSDIAAAQATDLRAEAPCRGPSDVSAAARALLTNPFITGETLHVGGGARWA